MAELTTPLSSTHPVKWASLKNRKHLHSFTTTFIKPLADMIAAINATRTFPLRCNREEQKVDYFRHDMCVPNTITTFATCHRENSHPATVTLEAIKFRLEPCGQRDGSVKVPTSKNHVPAWEINDVRVQNFQEIARKFALLPLPRRGRHRRNSPS
ncbi:hypothetical protein, variant [Aphanomyces invadans]|uniref:Uncharacterized protein n=1 Tax=Aphanomyces invadans TaxID=157072 RepID=A0A024UKI6_9STRA|nr:hypothetical protein H310_03034 [Aphanomyces invadans]XP_008864997.1 hypothetical protein, variant [Aphanomyces invadans]ETW06921.1 hypothetical protein H310_03034 [Aphanomyces invadans]ETW06922.1 hypothetical protein, variant [Aphanomyces invadans]|eukprot:XP_008864996.1 hypothetical protein H310_03034 [Aphanomyces invadans]